MKHKIIFVGDAGVGKTTIINNYLKSNEEIHPTLGAAIHQCTVDVCSNQVLLDIWDTAGQDEFRCLIPMYSRNAELAIVVYDQHDLNTFKSIKQWLDHMKNEVSVPFLFLVGNKSDLDQFVRTEDAFHMAQEYGATFLNCSALTGLGIDDLFNQAAEKVLTLEGKQPFSYQPNESLHLDNTTNKKGCCN